MNTNDQNKEEQISGGSNEDLIELTDVVDQPFQGGTTAPEKEPEESLSLDEETPGEKEEIIELVDAAKDEPEFEDSEVVDLTDMVEQGEDLQTEEEELSKLSGTDFTTEEPDGDILLEDVGMEMPQEDLDRAVSQKPENLVASEDSEVIAVDTGEIPSTGDSAGAAAEYAQPGPPPYTSVQPTDEALKSAILEKVSDEKLEQIITRVVKETIEKKADRILLEVAESAVGKELEKLKQSL